MHHCSGRERVHGAAPLPLRAVCYAEGGGGVDHHRLRAGLEEADGLDRRLVLLKARGEVSQC